MKIAIVGTGYVGLVSGACFAEMGADVTCIDVDKRKIEMLRKGQIPIYEPGLEELVARNVADGRLHFSTELGECLDEVEIVFSAVGTPPDEDGSADLRYVLEVAREFGRKINRYTLLVTKSTVPVGTAQRVKQAVAEELAARGVEVEFDVASNPEFLKEGDAIDDFMKPDRVVVGVESERAKQLMERLYKPFMMNNYRMIFTDVASAEMIKYAANSMLATRISFMNDIANLCEIVGADVNMVRKGIGADARIGSKFLYAGCGYGGSCFPKDVKALIRTAEQKGYRMRVLEAVEAVNERQKGILYEKFEREFDGEVEGRCVAMWGLSFKPETDDMREAPSLVLIERLLAAGCRVRVFDPIAMDEARRRLGDRVEYCASKYDALEGTDALMIVTEWKQFRLPNW
ncbi:MAG: UDP-glucose/GDP-mannose dehydrogenase family protein, partial [Rikenellaceae bacterium]|nr:UDP-glucose/GDP-mannose dehydrogenase family protein [Rikenellaceae bacterium]